MRLFLALSRFATVGVVATGIHVAVAATLIKGFGIYPGIANGAAFLVANFFSYFANTRWTFAAPLAFGNWWRFFSVSILAWLFTVALTSLVAELGGHYLLGIGLVVVLVPALTFAVHRKWTYRPKVV